MTSSEFALVAISLLLVIGAGVVASLWWRSAKQARKWFREANNAAMEAAKKSAEAQVLQAERDEAARLLNELMASRRKRKG